MSKEDFENKYQQQNHEIERKWQNQNTVTIVTVARSVTFPSEGESSSENVKTLCFFRQSCATLDTIHTTTITTTTTTTKKKKRMPPRRTLL
jgi:hypothetical protein